VVEVAPRLHGKIGATGFCYGGSTANMLAVRLGVNLAVAAPFYWRSSSPQRTSRRLRRRSWCITENSTPGWRPRGRIRQGAERGKTFRTKAIFIRAQDMASIAMRRRNGITRLRPIWPGNARSTGSTNTCEANSAGALCRAGRAPSGSKACSPDYFLCVCKSAVVPILLGFGPMGVPACQQT